MLSDHKQSKSPLGSRNLVLLHFFDPHQVLINNFLKNTSCFVQSQIVTALKSPVNLHHKTAKEREIICHPNAERQPL